MRHGDDFPDTTGGAEAKKGIRSAHPPNRRAESIQQETYMRSHLSIHGVLSLSVLCLIEFASPIEARAHLSPPHLSASEEAQLLAHTNTKNIKPSPIQLEGRGTITAPYWIHLVDFFKSARDLSKPEVVRIELFNSNRKVHLGSRILGGSDQTTGYGCFHLDGSKIEEALREGPLVLRIYPGIRDDLFGDIFAAKGLERSISGAKSLTLDKEKAQALLTNLRKKGSISINRAVLEINSIQVFEDASTLFKIEFWDGRDQLLDTKKARSEQGRVFLTGSRMRSAASRKTLTVRIYPGMYAVLPSYWEVFSEDEYYEFNADVDPDLIPALSQKEENALWEGIETKSASITHSVDHRDTHSTEIRIPHHLKGDHGMLVKVYNSRDGLEYTQVVGFDQDGPITFDLFPESAPGILWAENQWSTIELTPGISIVEVNRMLLGKGAGAFILEPNDAVNYSLFSKRSFYLRVYVTSGEKGDKIEPATLAAKKKEGKGISASSKDNKGARQ